MTKTAPKKTTGHKLAGWPSGRLTKWVIVSIWLVLVAVAGPLAGKLQGAESNDTSTWLPSKAESTLVLNAQSAFQSQNTIPAVMVYDRSSELTAADQVKVREDMAAYGRMADVVQAPSGPIFSSDKKAAEVVMAFDLGSNGWSHAGDIAKSLHDIADKNAGGLTMHITGPLGQASDSSKAFSGIDGTLLYSALAVVTVLLLITYRSPLLWLLPIISAGVSLMCSQGIIYLLAKHAGLTVNAMSAGILTVLVFGASTDYALLLIARYREELHNHEDRHEAMGLALHRAGPAIIASASTVAVGMLCLAVAEMNSTKGLGPVAAIGIGVGLLVMITFLPAMLVIFGRWLFWPLVPRHGTEVPSARGFWAKMGGNIAKRPRTVWVVTAAVLLVMSLGMIGFKANGLTDKQSYRNTPESVVGENVISQHYPVAGAGEPVVVTANAASSNAVQQALHRASGIANVTPPVVKNGTVLFEATLTSAPDSDAAYATIDSVRSLVHAVPGASAKVGGLTAITLDTERASTHDREVIIPLVLVVVFVILAILLRSLATPLMLILTVVLSFAATLGACAQLFKHAFHFGGADASFPLYVFVFLVALGIDYNIFLMTRVREESVKQGTVKGARVGLAATGAVITSAGAVLAGTFAALATLPITSFTEMGFAVAFGVLLDTLIVRSVLVTSLTLDIGKRIWWPSKLAKAKQ